MARADRRLTPGGLRAETALTVGAALGSTFLAGLASLGAARVLGVDDQGAWAVMLATAVLAASVGTLGFQEAAPYAILRSAVPARRATAARACALALVLGLLTALVVLPIAFLTAAGDPGTAAACATAALAGALVVFGVLQRAVQATLGPGWYAPSLLVAAGGKLAAVIVLWAVDAMSPAAVGTVWAVASLAGAATAAVGLARGTGRGAIDVRGALAAYRPHAGFALATLATIGATTVAQRVDILLVEGLQDVGQAGLYSVAVQLGDLLLVAPGAIGIVVFRRGASGHGDHWEDFVRATRWTLVLGVVAGAVTAAAATPLLELVFGDAYGDAATALRLLVPGIVILAVQSVVSHYVASRGRPRAVMVAWAVAAVAMIAGDLLVIPDHGIEGAAVVSSVGYALCLVLHLPALRAARRVADGA